MSKSIVRSVKNVTKGYSSVQVKVRDATSNDAWGPSGTDMNEIAQLTFNAGDFQDIVEMLDKRLNDKGKNWRHVLKSLKVLDYCLHEGSEHVVTWARNNIYIIKTLREFQYTDEENRDVGLNVRQSAKELSSLIMDEERLRSERKDRKNWKSRVTGLDEFGPAPGYAGGSSSAAPSPARTRKATFKNAPTNEDNDLEFKLALEASKNAMEEDQKRRQSKVPYTDTDDDDLRKAIKLSEEEEELRRRELEDKNASSLFDDTPVQQSQATGWNQGYQQQGAVDWFGNPLEQQQQQQQQPQTTGFLNNAYGMQPHQTGFQNGIGYSNPYQQPQQTGIDQFQQQQQQQSYIQPQQTAFNMNNPYSQQNPVFGEQQQQPLQPQTTLQPGTNNPWGSISSPAPVATNAFDNLKPQPTGSNNPFASGFGRPQTSPAPNRVPTLNALQEQRTAVPHQQPQNPQHAHLNALLASGEGLDTFGNTGNMRIPAQHTAPGTFVNSAGHVSNRLQTSQTGATNNPFLSSQYTGLPNLPQQPQQQFPAQTGPVGGGFGGYGNGFGGAGASTTSNNPFGAGPQQQQQQSQPQGGSLIDF